MAHEVLEQDAQREWETAEVADFLLDGLKAEIGIGLAADLQFLASLEAVGMGGGHIRILLEVGFLRVGGKIGARAGPGNRRMRAVRACVRLM